MDLNYEEWNSFRKRILRSNFPVPEKVKIGLSKPSISLDNLRKIISHFIVKYDKKSLLEWIYATSILPGNEIYDFRFLFIKQLILSIPNSKFSNKQANCKDIEKIMELTEKFNWFLVEDFNPIKINKSNIFGLEDKIYNFFPENLEIPEQFLETIVTRYFDFEKLNGDTNKYSIKKEFKKILEFQDSLLNIVIENKEKSYKNNNFIIPKDKFVEIVKIYLEKKIIFSKNLWDNYTSKVPEPMDIKSEFFIDHPRINDVIYSPASLFYSFGKKVVKDIEKASNKEIKSIIKKQFWLEVYLSILEIATAKGILYDFKINYLDRKIDFGITYDNKFFFFMLVEEDFIQNNFEKKIKDLIDFYKELKSEFKKGSIKVKVQNDTTKIKDALDPFFFIITDEFKDIKLTSSPILGDSIYLLSSSCLRYIFEDISEKEQSAIYLCKTVKLLEELSKGSITQCLSLCDFYDMVTYKKATKDDISSFSFYDKKLPNLTYINAHIWSNNIRNRYNERPIIDLRPNEYKRPFTFKIKKFSDKTYGGYNHFLNKIFLCYKDNIEVFVLYDKNTFFSIKNLKKRDIFEDCTKFLQKFIIGFFEIFLDKELIGDVPSKQITIEIIPKELALKEKIVEDPPNFPLLIGGFGPNKILIILEPIDFAELYKLDSKFVMQLLIHSIISKFVNKTQLDIIKNKAKEINPEKIYKITRTATVATNTFVFFWYPTDIDFMKYGMLEHTYSTGKFKNGIYKGKDAEKILNDLTDFLFKELTNKLKEYDLESLLRFSYSEIERTRKAKVISSIDFRLSQGMDLKYDNEEKLLEVEEKLNLYSPCCRYLLELSLFLNISGTKKMNIDDWQSICPIVMKILNYCSLSDYIYYLSDILDITVEINNKTLPAVRYLIKEDPILKKQERHIEGLKTIDLKPFLFSEKHKKKTSKDGVEYTPNRQLIEETMKKGEKIFGEGELKLISDQLQKSFGFSLNHYSLILNILTHIEPEPSGLVIIKKDELLDFVFEKTKIEKKIIEKVINFSTLNHEKPDKSYIEFWKENPRKNRITIKPFVKLNEKLIFGHHALIFALEKIIFSFIDGQCPYSIELLPEGVKKALIKKKQSSSDEFETAVYEEIKNHSDFCERDICSHPGKNDKCLINIKEKCPGQLDVLSLHLKNKTIMIWDAKHIDEKFGTHEICNKINTFTKKNDGFIDVNKKKEAFIKRYYKTILNYYTVKDKEGWKIKSCIVLSSDHMVKFILEKKCDIINFFDISKYIVKL